jgi:hypothetical protein
MNLMMTDGFQVTNCNLSRLEEWSVARITDHHGTGSDALFEVEYTTRDHVWLPYHEVS